MDNADREIEARWIKVDEKKMAAKLESIGAKIMHESFFKEWVFAYPEWQSQNKRIRVRDDGKKSWVTYKSNETFEVDSTQEIEIESSSSHNSARILEKIGIPMVRYQEKKRISYLLGDVKIDFDFWPKIPMVLEIEAPTKEQVMETAERLGLKWEDAIFVNQKILHKEYFGIDLDLVREYKF